MLRYGVRDCSTYTCFSQHHADKMTLTGSGYNVHDDNE